MCGILGWIGFDAAREQAFRHALADLAHRGPDDSGTWFAPSVAFGHRRLSILDLSAAGHQPMCDALTGAVLVFNGEIYNYLELRKELEAIGHVFVGGSDTEVLLVALREWGTQTLPRLNGMFAFAYWQPQRRELLLARDRFGVKPLYYMSDARGLAFTSEPKALHRLFPDLRAINPTTLLEFLAYNLVHAQAESCYRGISQVLPAHYAIYSQETRNLDIRQYWDYPAVTPATAASDDPVGEFSELFTDAVRIRMRSDVQVGLTLSGGLDSTGILAAASTIHDRPLTCFTSVYGGDEHGELPWARLAADSAGAHLIPVEAPQGQWLETLRTVTGHIDSPGYSPAVYSLWELMRRARQENVIVLLEGQGADEALGGYPQYAALAMIDALAGRIENGRNPRDIVERLVSMRRTFGVRWSLAWMARELSPTMLRWHRRRSGFASLLRPGVTLPPPPPVPFAETAETLGRRLRADHARNILPGLLHHGDAVSMAHGIETRHPFLDFRLVEWMFKISARVRTLRPQTKWILREFLARHGQESIAIRPDKQGYPIPSDKWMAGEQGRELEALLVDRPSPLHEWCDPEKIRHMIAQNRAGRMASSHHLYKLLSTQIWIETCVERFPS